MDILACPIDKYYPLELHVFEEKDEIVEGIIVCPKCNRWYPIRDEISDAFSRRLLEIHRRGFADHPHFVSLYYTSDKKVHHYYGKRIGD